MKAIASRLALRLAAPILCCQSSCGDAPATPAAPGPATTIAASAGEGQTAPAGSATSIQPSVKVTRANGSAMGGVIVTFSAVSGGGSVTGANQTTDASGVATVSSWTLGSAPGPNTLTAASVGLTGSPVLFSATGTAPFSSLATGGNHSCGLKSGGLAYCWGRNSWGQIGIDSTTTRSNVPMAVLGGLTFASLSSGFDHSCGLTSGGTAFCFGRNPWGQLGNGSNANSVLPVVVSGGLTFASLTTGGAHTCGLTSSGAAYCWGFNSNGQLGNGSTTESSVPVAVLGGLTFASLSAGVSHSCGLTSSGAAYCWGFGAGGALGNGSATEINRLPLAVSGGLTFAGLATGGDHTCGLTTSGAAYCWGGNYIGQLGISSITTNSLLPVAVSGGQTFASLTAGAEHTCGLSVDGVAYCWGDNRLGALGNGSTSTSSVPAAVSGGLVFASLRAGGIWGTDHTCGLTSGGKAYCWGTNSNGQLGDGTFSVNRLVPVIVVGQ